MEVGWRYCRCFIIASSISLPLAFLKRCMNLITGCFCLSIVVSSVHSTSHNRPFSGAHGSVFSPKRRIISVGVNLVIGGSQKTCQNRLCCKKSEECGKLVLMSYSCDNLFAPRVESSTDGCQSDERILALLLGFWEETTFA